MSLLWFLRSIIVGFYLYRLQKYFFHLNTSIYILFHFKKPINTIIKIRNKKYPFILEKKNGKTIEIKSKIQLSFILKKMENMFSIENNLLTIKFNSKLLKFTNYESMELDIFSQKLYSNISVKNKTVIDVGGGVGDSALLFRTLGAKKVVMIEPEPAFFESAKQNIELNKELQNIEIHNLVLSSTIGIYMIDHKQSGDLGEINESKENGVPIPKITIDKFLSNYHEQNFVLKMDCESCEYDVLLPIPEDTLRKFEQIFIEFHNGCLNISQRLEKSGFKIKILNSKLTPKKRCRGHLLATRNKL
jgi:FkbM family methyltransferase